MESRRTDSKDTRSSACFDKLETGDAVRIKRKRPVKRGTSDGKSPIIYGRPTYDDYPVGSGSDELQRPSFFSRLLNGIKLKRAPSNNDDIGYNKVSEIIANTTFHSASKGYDFKDVDAFLDEISADFDRGDVMIGKIKSVSFSIARKGYDIDEVDDFLESLCERVDYSRALFSVIAR